MTDDNVLGAATNFATTVFYVTKSPGGLVGDRWVVDHRCLTCKALADTADLVDHAKAHAIEERS